MTVRDREFRRRLGLGLRVLGQARGMTQEEVAARAGFCGKYISARTGLPRDALEIARVIAGLPQRHRRLIAAIVRAALSLAADP